MRQITEKLPVQHRSRDDEQQIREKEQLVRVVIVDAHLLIREALHQIIQGFPHMCISASTASMQDTFPILKQGKAHVLILGSSLKICECLEYIQAVRQIQPSPGIVVIQQRLHAETAFPIIKSGVQGLLGEDASARDLAQAIRAVATGSTFLGQRAREILNDHVSHVPLHFTAREMQVLPLLRLGLSNFCIAQQLSLKEKTVEKHLTHIYEKLHSRSRTEAMVRLQTLYI